MVTGPDLSSQREVSVSMETDQLSGNLLLFMHCPGGEGHEGAEEREGWDVTVFSSACICILKRSTLSRSNPNLFRINPAFENEVRCTGC